MASIRLDQLTKDFGGLLAVDHVDIEIEDGTFLALLGPSGCGKTTTMNMISGLETPTSGEVYFGDRPMSRVPPGKRSVGFVFQNYAIFTHMTVAQNLSFGLRVRKPRPSRVEIESEVKRVAEIVGLSAMLQRKASRLSVNDMQKVALGRSMIVKPSIFLLDEPFSNLDAAFRAYMRAELKHIQHEIGQTMVYVTHDQVEAMGMADQIAVMNLGVLQQFAPPLEIYNRPSNKFVAGFVGSTRINFLPAEKVGLPAPTGTDGGSVTLAIRPEYIGFIEPGAAEATVTAKVDLVEPLGASDVIHLSWERYDIRAIGRPGRRPRIGDNLGLVFPPEHLLFFDDKTEKAVNGSHQA
jgi:multiple sugar transport system ATP-binding protein